MYEDKLIIGSAPGKYHNINYFYLCIFFYLIYDNFGKNLLKNIKTTMTKVMKLIHL